MNRMIKYAAAAGVAGVLTLGMAAPSQARYGHNAAAIGFGAGALVGAAAANAANGGYYGYGRDYGYDYAAPGYAYAAPGYRAYAYMPRHRGGLSCDTQGGYGHRNDYANCY